MLTVMHEFQSMSVPLLQMVDALVKEVTSRNKRAGTAEDGGQAEGSSASEPNTKRAGDA